MPLMSREIYYLGGRNLVPLLELCLPVRSCVLSCAI